MSSSDTFKKTRLMLTGVFLSESDDSPLINDLSLDALTHSLQRRPNVGKPKDTPYK